MRKFNTSGPNIIEKHYTLPRPSLIEKGKEMVYRSQYFMIFSPHQTGKTTYLRLLATELRSEGYKVAHLNFENFNKKSEEDFLVQFGIELFNQWALSFDVSSIVGLFGQIERIQTGKMVLIVEGIEDINNAYVWTFLSSIRSVFHSRQRHTLKSVILAGVRNTVRNAPDDRIPFNIGDSLELPYFSDVETRALIGQHEKETGQLFDEKVIAKISEITANHPALVNGLLGTLQESERFCVTENEIDG